MDTLFDTNDTLSNQLLRQGFVPSGKIMLKKNGLGLVDAPPMVAAVVGVYAFVIDENEIAYIGSSTRDLAHRIYMHGFSFESEKVNSVDAQMRPLLEAGRRIDVWVCTNPTVP